MKEFECNVVQPLYQKKKKKKTTLDRLMKIEKWGQQYHDIRKRIKSFPTGTNVVLHNTVNVELVVPCFFFIKKKD